MRVTKWGEYGILCCIFLGRSPAGTTIGANEISEAQGIPLQYAQQILHRLKKGGIISTTRGPKGGYRLVKPISELNLREILYAAEGDTFEVVCEHNPIYGEQCAHSNSCNLKGVWQDLKEAVDKLLSERTLESVIVSSSPKPAAEQIVNIHAR